MRIRITRQPQGEVDGISLAELEVGLIYELSPSVATYLISLGNAEPILDAAPIPPQFERRVSVLSEKWRAVAADRRKTKR